MRTAGQALRVVGQVVRGLVTAGLVVVVLALGVAVVPAVAGFEARSVLSSSMEPGIPAGSLVLTRTLDAEDVDVGDVVLLRPPAGAGTPPVLHRVVEVRPAAEGVQVRTKGDDNPVPDPGVRTIVGRTATPAWVLPVLGQAHTELTSPRGWFGFVVVPAAALCALQLVRIWRPDRARPAEPVPTRV